MCTFLSWMAAENIFILLYKTFEYLTVESDFLTVYT